MDSHKPSRHNILSCTHYRPVSSQDTPNRNNPKAQFDQSSGLSDRQKLNDMFLFVFLEKSGTEQLFQTD